MPVPLGFPTVGFKYTRIVQKRRAERRAPCTDGPLTHFASPSTRARARCILRLPRLGLVRETR